MKKLLRIAKWTGIVVGIIALAAIVFMTGRWTAPATTAGADRAEADATADAAPEREQIYTCPMHPQVRTTDPNEMCPICAMELVPLEDDDAGEDDGELPRLRVSERAAALMNIQTVPARRTAAEREVRLYGRVDYDERRLRTIAAWTDGRIDRLHIEYTGQRVERDEPMIELYSPMLIAAQEEVLSAIKARSQFRDRGGRNEDAGIEAARDRLRLLGVGSAFIDELETTGEVRERIPVSAPLGGIVTARLVNLGDYVSTGQPMYRIADLSHLWVQFSVFESDLPWLRVGQRAVFTSPSFPGQEFEGTVSFIDPVLDDRTRSVRVRVDLPNEGMLLKPGMFVRGAVHASMDMEGRASDAEDVRNHPLVIPASAPLITGRRAVVYVRLADEERPTFEGRDVVLGPRAGDSYIVREGLDAGELVVVHGQFRIDSELQIRGRPSMMQPAATEEVKAQPRVADDHPALAIRPHDVPDAFAERLADVLEDYLALSHALSQDDFDDGATFAHELHERLYELDVEMLDEHVREAWEQLDKDLHHVLHELLEAEDIDGLRVSLEPLTEFIAITVANFIGDRAGTIFRAHCPMVDDNRGADWLQRERQIANPYFGSMMFRCGEIVGEVQDELRDEPDEPGVPDWPEHDEPVMIDVPTELADEIRDLLLSYDELTGAIEHDHEQHARDVIRTMQDRLLALDLAEFDEPMTRAWMAIDIEIVDALRAMLEADSIIAMRKHLPHLRESVERARNLIQPRDDGGDA